MNFFKKNGLRLISSIIVFGMLIFAFSYIQTEHGKQIFEFFIKNLPFCKFIYTTVKNLFNVESLPDFNFNSQLYDFTKLMLTTTLSSIFTAFFSRIFLNLDKRKIFYNQYAGKPELQDLYSFRRSQIIEEAEEEMSKKWYKFVSAIIKSAVKVLMYLITNYILIYLVNWLNAISDKTYGTIIHLILFVLVYLICTIIFMIGHRYRFSLSVILIAGFHLLPEAISLVGTNVLMVFLYYNLVANGGIGKIIISVVLIALWQIITDFITEKIQLFLVKWCKKKEEFILFSIPYNIVLFFTTISTVMISYYMCISNYGVYDPTTDYFLDLPFLSEYAQGMNIMSLMKTDSYLFLGNFLALILICVVISASHVSPIQFANLGIIITWPFVEGVYITLVVIINMIFRALLNLQFFQAKSYVSLLILTGILLLIIIFMRKKLFIFQSILAAIVLVVALFTAQYYNVVLGPSGNVEVQLIVLIIFFIFACLFNAVLGVLMIVFGIGGKTFLRSKKKDEKNANSY